jgi:hypothetical protein
MYLYSTLKTMASDGSPRPTTSSNMIEPSANMAQTSFYYACAEVTLFKRPRRTLLAEIGGGRAVGN